MPTQILRPNAPGYETNIPIQFPNSGAHWDKVDDVSPDEDTTYVDSYSTGGFSTDNDLYNLENFVGSGNITNVRVYVRWRSFGGDAFLSAGILLRNAGVTNLWNFFGISSSYEDDYRDWATNPQTGNPWSVADINALQAGIRLRNLGVFKWSRCTQVYIEVTYTLGHSQAHII